MPKKVKTITFALKDMLKEYGDEKVKELLYSFSCSKNKQVEMFLKNSSILFEKKNKSRTYLIFENNSYKFLAYYTLTISTVKIKQASKKLLQKLDGISRENKEVYPVYLIGQLGKNDAYWNRIKGDYILEEAIDAINSASSIVGGRIILIETQNNENLKKFYERNKFKLLQSRTDDKGNEYLQMYRLI
jgi:hypothetical protein